MTFQSGEFLEDIGSPDVRDDQFINVNEYEELDENFDPHLVKMTFVYDS